MERRGIARHPTASKIKYIHSINLTHLDYRWINKVDRPGFGLILMYNPCLWTSIVFPICRQGANHLLH